MTPMGPWTRLMAAGAVAGTALAVVSGAAGWGTAHRLLAALALPWIVGLVIVAWMSARRLLPAALTALIAFGLAALLDPRAYAHIAFAAIAFGATALLAAQVARDAGRGYVDPRDYVTLTKPRVMSLLLLTGGAAIFVGAGGLPGWSVFALTMIGLALACGGAAALNHYLDRDIDQLMGERTATRPVASGRLAPELALEFGVALSALSFVLLDSLVNLPTALLALAGNLFYVFVYTRWLKRSTPQNIVIGGAAGAVPPLVGYAGASGHLGWAALVMFGIVFLWTPPHFWALALMIREHYANAGVPMLPVVRGERETAKQIVLVHLALVAATLPPSCVRRVRPRLRRLGARARPRLRVGAYRLWRDTTRRHAALLFHYSLLYLALLLSRWPSTLSHERASFAFGLGEPGAPPERPAEQTCTTWLSSTPALAGGRTCAGAGALPAVAFDCAPSSPPVVRRPLVYLWLLVSSPLRASTSRSSNRATGSGSQSRTCSTPRACARRTVQPSSPTTCRLRPPKRCSHSSARATRTSARRICTSSPTASHRRISITARCRTRPSPGELPEARAAAPPRRSQPGSPTLRSGPTQGDRSASPRRAARSSDSSRATGSSPPRASSRSRRASTTSGRWPATSRPVSS